MALSFSILLISFSFTSLIYSQTIDSDEYDFEKISTHKDFGSLSRSIGDEDEKHDKSENDDNDDKDDN